MPAFSGLDAKYKERVRVLQASEGREFGFISVVAAGSVQLRQVTSVLVASYKNPSAVRNNKMQNVRLSVFAKASAGSRMELMK